MSMWRSLTGLVVADKLRPMRTGRLDRIMKEGTGQAAVEYLLTTVSLVMLFVGLYGFLQGQLRDLFRAAGLKILMPYY